MANARVQIVVLYQEDGEAFADALIRLLCDVLGLDGGAVRSRHLQGSRGAALPEHTLDPHAEARVVLLVTGEIADEFGEPGGPSVPAVPASAANRHAAATTDGDPLFVALSLQLSRPATGPSAATRFRAGVPTELEEVFGQVAGKLGAARTLDLLPYRARFEALAAEARRSQPYRKGVLRQRQKQLGALLGVGLLGLGAYALGLHRFGFGRFEFEEDGAGWSELNTVSKGCTRVGHSSEHSKHGQGSLELEVRLDPGSDAQRAGEAWVDLRRSTLDGLSAPLDLGGRRVTAWVYTPLEASGSPDAPNGFQLFVKDANFRTHYGPWTNAKADSWTEVALEVGTETRGSKPAPDFLGSNVVALGVKLELAGRARVGFTGSVYLDGVDF